MYIKNSRQCFVGYPNTSNFVKNTPLRLVFSTLFSVFGYPDETLSLVFDILLETITTHTRINFNLWITAGLHLALQFIFQK